MTGCIERLNRGEAVDPLDVVTDQPAMAREMIEDLRTYLSLGTAEEPAIGKLGDYTLLRKLGQGGMGIVYEAFQESMGRRVALKVLPMGIAGDRRRLDRFVREAKIAGSLRHPNIVSVHSLGAEAGSPYYAMELVEGETLDKVLARARSSRGIAPGSTGSFEDISRLLRAPASGDRESGSAQKAGEPTTPPPGRADLALEEVDLKYCLRVAEAFAGVADALRHAHGRGVIHRDIKPSNLIIDGDGRVRILDFGLAWAVDAGDLTRSGEAVGTPLYMSPEQVERRKVSVDHRTDMYSLGATLYEMLTLRPPFQGRDDRETMSRILGRDPRPVHALNPRVPKDLETIVLKCLVKEPDGRYRTAEALAQDLRRFARGDPVEARPQPLWEKLGRRAWRRKGILSAALLVILLAVTALFLYSHIRRETQARSKDPRP